MVKGNLIGRGRTAEIYEWEHGKVLKLFYDWVSKESIQYEMEIGRAVYHAGVPAPIVYDSVEQGIVYEQINGKTMLQLLGKKPWLFARLARDMARLQANIHRCSISNLPQLNHKMVHAIKKTTVLSEDKVNRILTYIESLPQDKKLCHGDFHPDNILVTENDVIAIDWTNAYLGNSLSDVARTYLLTTSPFMPQGTPKVILAMANYAKRLLASIYIKEYIKLAKINPVDLTAWLLPTAAARLSEKVPGEEQWLLGIIDKELERLGL